jgi:hypothetical protein
MLWNRLRKRPSPRTPARTLPGLEQLETRLVPAFFGTAATYGAGANPGVVAVGDFDEGGFPDLAVTNQNDGTVSVLISDGAGGFPTTSATLQLGGTPEGIATADLNKDGHLDLAVANNNGFVQVALGNGNGTFQTTNLFLGGIPDFVAIGDFDQDGNPDLAVAQFDIGGFAGAVTVLRGNGTGSYSTGQKVTLTGLAHAEQVVVADFDGDGKPDLAVPSQLGATGVTVYRNTTGENGGAGLSFGPVFRVNTGLNTGAATINFGCTGLVAADFNGDGRPDLAVTNLGDLPEGGNIGVTASVFRNQSSPGALAFGGALNLTAGTLPVGVTAGDFNNDGKLDLAVANNGGGGRISVFLNNGALLGPLSFPATPNHYAVGPNPQILAATYLTSSGQVSPAGGRAPDLNKDGLPDLAVAVQNGNQDAAVLLNRSGSAVTLRSSKPNAAVGESVTITATVTPSFPDAPPTGFVSFFDASNFSLFVGLGMLDGNGTASFSTSSLGAGVHNIFAVYDGDANYAKATSATLAQNVGVTPTRGDDTAGVFDPATATFYIRNRNSAGAPDVTPFAFGAPNWLPVTGDWDGDGRTTVGVVDPATETFYLRNRNSAGGVDFTPFAFGAPGWVPLAGDWDGNGTTTAGVFDPNTATFYLRNRNTAGGVDYTPFAFGAPGWVPVVGDWDGNGTDTVGVFDPNTATFYLRNSNSAGAPDVTPFAFGGRGWKPVAGDWDRDGRTGVGVFDPAGRWYLRNSTSGGAPDFMVFGYGAGSWMPLAGDWDFASMPARAAGVPAALAGGTTLPATAGRIDPALVDRLLGQGVPATTAVQGPASAGQIPPADLSASLGQEPDSLARPADAASLVAAALAAGGHRHDLDAWFATWDLG